MNATTRISPHAAMLLACVLAGTASASSSPLLPMVIGDEHPELVLDVLIANDDDFAPIDASQAAVILEEARRTLATKFDFSAVAFRVQHIEKLEKFFARHKDSMQECLTRFAPVQARPGGPKASSVDTQRVLEFLKRWSSDELRQFFKEEVRATLPTHQDIATKLMAEFDRKIESTADFQLANGRSLLAPNKLDVRSYVQWICGMRVQDEADLVLTNTFILYDLASEPYPHSIFGKAKVGGASLASPKRTAMRGRAMLASTFSMVTDIPYFFEEGADTLSAQERFQVIGTFIVAHELGHALFKMPDFYDHPAECLMTTKYETGYVTGFRELKMFPDACNRCKPYVDARRHLFVADKALAQRDWDTAIAAIAQCQASTPQHIDGSRDRYMADLTVEIAHAHFNQGNFQEAARRLVEALRQFPGHPGALELRQRVLNQHRKSAQKRGN